MIIAVVLADRTTPEVQGQPLYALPCGGESVLERVTRIVLRGPFGATIVVAPHGRRDAVAALLKGFSVKIIESEAADAAQPRPHAALIAALAYAEKVRERWARAMATAAASYSVSEQDEVNKTSTQKGEPHTGPSTQTPTPPQGTGKTDPWAKLRTSSNIRLRGLARSFEREGVIVFRADRPLLRPELQAAVVEAFGRDTSGVSGRLMPIKATEIEGKISTGRRFSQAVYAGKRGYPVVMNVDAAHEVQALPPETDFDAWLTEHHDRVRDVPVDDPAAVEAILTEADYQRLCAKLPKKD